MKQKAFTLMELMIVIVIIGILAAVGMVTFGGQAEKAKIAASKTNFKNATKWIRLELIKCNAGLSDKMFTSNPQSCPITHSNTFSSGMNNACRARGGVFSEIKNPYDQTIRACRLAIEYKRDVDVGYFNWSQKDWQNIRFSSCWKKPCNDTNNHEQIIINVTE